jgi:hypothetical protein
MDTKTLFEILTMQSVEELNDSIKKIGKKKMVNAIAFIYKDEIEEEKGENQNE